MGFEIDSSPPLTGGGGCPPLVWGVAKSKVVRGAVWLLSPLMGSGSYPLPLLRRRAQLCGVSYANVVQTGVRVSRH